MATQNQTQRCRSSVKLTFNLIFKQQALKCSFNIKGSKLSAISEAPQPGSTQLVSPTALAQIENVLQDREIIQITNLVSPNPTPASNQIVTKTKSSAAAATPHSSTSDAARIAANRAANDTNLTKHTMEEMHRKLGCVIERLDKIYDMLVVDKDQSKADNEILQRILDGIDCLQSEKKKPKRNFSDVSILSNRHKTFI